MTAPSLRGGGSVVKRRLPGTPLERIADPAATARRSRAAVSYLLLQVWAVAVLLMAGVAAVGGKGVPGADRHRLHISPVVGRAGSILYQNTMQYLMDQMAPSMPPSRSASYNPDVACMGAVYQRGSGGSVCVDAVTAAAVVGVALLLQFLFYLTVVSACPAYSTTGSRYGNVTYVITVDNSNTIGVDVMGGDQMLEQDQTQEQTQDQDQTQNGVATQTAPQTINVQQDQDQQQDQTQMQTNTGRNFRSIGKRGGSRHRQRRWTLPSLFVTQLDLSNLLDWSSGMDWSGISLTLCPLVGRYLGH